jgi:hypothetical protein
MNAWASCLLLTSIHPQTCRGSDRWVHPRQLIIYTACRIVWRWCVDAAIQSDTTQKTFQTNTTSRLVINWWAVSWLQLVTVMTTQTIINRAAYCVSLHPVLLLIHLQQSYPRCYKSIYADVVCLFHVMYVGHVYGEVAMQATITIYLNMHDARAWMHSTISLYLSPVSAPLRKG